MKGNCALAVVLALAWGARGCGDIKGLDDEVLPIARIPVVLTGDFSGITADSHLYVALLWGEPPRGDPFCDRAARDPSEDARQQAVVAAGCPEPYYIAPREVAAVMPVPRPAKVDGSFWFELFEAPATYDGSESVFFGSLVVFYDNNGNGRLDLLGRTDGGSAPSDRILGASIAPEFEVVVAIAYREASPSNYLDHCVGGSCLTGECALPKGFSRVAMAPSPPPPGELPASGCDASSLSQGIVVFIKLTGDPELSALRCPFYASEVTPASYFTQFPDEPDAPWVCESPDHLVVAAPPDAPCAEVKHYLLRGCYSDPYCAEFEFDERANAPAWWPCGPEVR